MATALERVMAPAPVEAPAEGRHRPVAVLYGPLAIGLTVWGAVLEYVVQALEAGLATPVGTRGVKLSGGQVQRTAAARMLVRDAGLLVIDEYLLHWLIGAADESAPLAQSGRPLDNAHEPPAQRSSRSRQRPFHSGRRFSTNAFSPSVASSDARAR